jgi:hypothetical protein
MCKSFHSVKHMKPSMVAYPRDNIQLISGNQLIFWITLRCKGLNILFAKYMVC